MEKLTTFTRQELLKELQVCEYWIKNKPFEHRHDWNKDWQKMFDENLKRKKEVEIELAYRGYKQPV